MKNYIFPIIKKQKERMQEESRRIPLYKRIPIYIEPPSREGSVNKNKEYIEIDFNVDEIKV
jgi:hypothetical protein